LADGLVSLCFQELLSLPCAMFGFRFFLRALHSAVNGFQGFLLNTRQARL
jgi:hypothetical protein